ncbi:hypothetical protein [Mycolicibacterium sp.]|uniref:hypothetical protein n=1 Tax=Mycolicibacterium sp. TaxID=2320850 RepID=UPI0037C9DAA3
MASVAAECVGLASINAGFWLIHEVAGLFATGASLILVGLAIDPPAWRQRQPSVNEGEAL